MGCLDENAIVGFLTGNLGIAAEVHSHIDGCEVCRQLVSTVARMMGTPSVADIPTSHPGVGAATLPLGAMDASGQRPTTPGADSAVFIGRTFVRGQIIADRYRLERPLGEGGSGVVWAATHVVLNRPIAIKFLKVSAPEDARRFHREAKITAMLHHPHIVQVHDLFDLVDGTPAMVMDLLTGESLRARFGREGAQPLAALARILLPVVSALRAVHAQGIVHRDLKPENVFLARLPDGASTVKVLDFGLAKVFEAGATSTKLTRTGALLGTPYYMAPEQVFAEKDIDARADLWALGVILYEGLSGVRPVDGKSFGQMFRQITVGDIVPLEARMPSVPPSIRELSRQLLQRDRRNRPPDVRVVEEALGPFAV